MSSPKRKLIETDEKDTGHGYFSDTDAIIALQKRMRQFEIMVGYVMDQAMPDEATTMAKLEKRIEKLENNVALCRCKIDLFHTPVTE
jgi:hypothetical protein